MTRSAAGEDAHGARGRPLGVKAHATQEHWLGQIVKLGTGKVTTKDTLTAKVIGIPGEYDSEAEALRAATRYVDEELERRQD